MTTTTVPVTITCPSWCEDSPQAHADDLWEQGGHSLHHLPPVVVPDPHGHKRPLEQPQFHDAIEIRLITCTSPDGREAESPVLFLEGHELSIQQAADLAAALTQVIEAYRTAGGVE